MKKIRSVILALLCVAIGPRLLAAEDSVLYWMVNDPVVYEYDETGRALFVEEVVSRPDGKTINGARVHVTGSDGTDLYLTMINDDGTPSPATYVNVSPAYSGEGGSYVGMTGGPAMSWVLGDYQTADYVFTMELGHWEDDEWLVMAASAGASWNDIKGFTSISDIGAPGGQHWAPEAAYVPEPSSGLLIVIGGALLALRRKRAVKAASERGI